eukprot:g17145.t1
MRAAGVRLAALAGVAFLTRGHALLRQASGFTEERGPGLDHRDFGASGRGAPVRQGLDVDLAGAGAGGGEGQPAEHRDDAATAQLAPAPGSARPGGKGLGLGRALRRARGLWGTAKGVAVRMGMGVQGVLARRWRALQRWGRRILDVLRRSDTRLTRLAVRGMYGKAQEVALRELQEKTPLVWFWSRVRDVADMPVSAFTQGGPGGPFEFYPGEGRGLVVWKRKPEEPQVPVSRGYAVFLHDYEVRFNRVLGPLARRRRVDHGRIFDLQVPGSQAGRFAVQLLRPISILGPLVESVVANDGRVDIQLYVYMFAHALGPGEPVIDTFVLCGSMTRGEGSCLGLVATFPTEDNRTNYYANLRAIMGVVVRRMEEEEEVDHGQKDGGDVGKGRG